MSPQEALQFERTQAPDRLRTPRGGRKGCGLTHSAPYMRRRKQRQRPAILRSAPRAFSGTLFRKGTLSLIDQGVVSATNFLTMILLGRTATQELGEYQLGFSSCCWRCACKAL